jgi:hypothetical protein
MFSNIFLGAFILHMVYAIYEGRREALYYHIKSISGLLKDKNEYPLFVCQSITFYGLIYLLLLTNSNFNYWKALVLLIMLIFTFPFFHDGSYYANRNNLDKFVYKKRFLDESNSNTEFFSATLRTRSVLVLFGAYFYYLIYKLWIV